MNKYHLSRMAQSHITEIKKYSDINYSEFHWENYKGKLLSGLNRIAEHPDLGKIYCEKRDIYSYIISSHIAYYQKIKDEDIMIFALLNQRQEPKGKF
ncbi:type II toxin-antitoxin system RelE/ParE family toxin [Vibrio sp.]|nr:type II toxin-antitoxin system RelE/ParE family toxin [Vibrio sp.]